MSRTVARAPGAEPLEPTPSGHRRSALNGSGLAVWAVAALTVLAFGLRLACLDQSLFGDELFLWAIVDHHSLGDVLSAVHDTEKTPPLGFVLAWLTTHLGHPHELVRLPSFLAGVATVPLVYLLGLRTVGRRSAFVAAAWFALSPFEIFYGTEARSYALVTALVVLSTLALLLAVAERRTRWWALYAVAAAAAVYSHYIAALTLVPQAAWALWAYRDTIRQQLVSGGLVVLAFLPWLPSFVVQIRHSSDEARRISEVVPLTLSNVGDFTLQALVSAPYVTFREVPGRVSLVVLAVLAVALLVGLARRPRPAWTSSRAALARPGALIVVLAVVPLVALVLYSARPDRSFLLSRNLSVAVPYALLAFGWLLTYPRGRLALALPVVALAAVSVGTVKMLTPDYQRPDAKDAARYVEAHEPPGAPVVDVPGPHAIRTYLPPSRRVYTTAQFGETQWAEAARTGSPVFFTAPRTAFYVAVLKPPDRFARRFRLVASHVSHGHPFEIVVRGYAPR